MQKRKEKGKKHDASDLKLKKLVKSNVINVKQKELTEYT